MKIKTVFVLTTLLFISCASSPKKQELSNDIAVPDVWTGLTSETSDTLSLWWDDFNDSKLESVLNEAFKNNRTLRIAASNVYAASAQAKIAGAPILPNLNLNFNGQRNKQVFIGLPIPGAEGKVLSNTSESFGVSMNMSWELDLWGKLRADQAAAVASFQAVQADLNGARLSLAAQVCKAWFAAIEAKRQVSLAEATLTNMQLSSDQVKTRYELGLVSSLDYRMSLSSLEISKSTLLQRKSMSEGSIRQLEILLGRYPAATLEISESLPEITSEVPTGIPSEIITRRPDLIAAERNLAAANVAVKSAKRAMFPQLTLTASTGTTAKEVTDLLDGDFSVWSLAGGILQPVFQRGRLRAGVDLAKQSELIALESYTLAALTAFGEVENALSNERYLKSREEAISAASGQSNAARILAEEQYASGVRDFITMLEAQRSAYENESQLLSVRRERLDARIDLYLALGGNFTYEYNELTSGAEKNE